MRRLWNIFQNYNFRTKIILTYFLVALVPMMGWIIFSNRQTDQTLRERAQMTLDANTKSIAEQLTEKLEKTEYTLQTFAFDNRVTEVVGGDFDSGYDKYLQVHDTLDSYLDAVRLLNLDIKQINIYSDGELKGARTSFKSMDELKENPIFEEINCSSEPVWYIEGRKVSVFQKMYNINNIRFCGVVEFLMNYEDIFVFSNSEYQETDWICVEAQDGTVLYEQGQKSEKTDDRMSSSSELSSWKWKLTVSRELKSLLLQPDETVSSLLLWLAVACLLLFAVILLFSRGMVKRLVHLNEQVKKIVPSNFKMDISSDYTDEIGMIANTIGMMIREARAMIREVYERKLSQRDAEYRALQAQINPHFLYNTLSMMRWKALKNHDAELARLISSLSNFYRTTLNRGDSVTTVEKELENVRSYLDIQMAIHEGRLEVRYEIEEGVKEYEMPGLILQPLVENAIEHGILECKREGSGHLVIRVRSNAEEIFLEVEDDGEGMTRQKMEEILVHSKKGYGVKNVNERLQLFFDEQYGLNFYSNEPYGTRAVVHIPKYMSVL